MFFWRIKQTTSILVQTKKKRFFARFCCKFVTFLRFFSFFAKNAENYYFDQRLGCAAPKCWSKYTTAILCRAAPAKCKIIFVLYFSLTILHQQWVPNPDWMRLLWEKILTALKKCLSAQPTFSQDLAGPGKGGIPDHGAAVCWDTNKE